MKMKLIWDRFTDRLGKTIIHPQFLLKRYEAVAIKKAKRYAHGILVDIGCGRQPYREELLPLVDKYIGVDHPKVSKKYVGRPPDILADATDIPLPGKYADIILMISVLEHLPFPSEALKEAARITKKNGILVLITVQNYPLHDAPYDFFRFTRFSLKNLIEEANFRVEKIIPLGNYPEFLFQTFNVYLFYKIKKIIRKGFFEKLVILTLLPFIGVISLMSNFLALILGELASNDDGAFAIYNLAVARKR